MCECVFVCLFVVVVVVFYFLPFVRFDWPALKIRFACVFNLFYHVSCLQGSYLSLSASHNIRSTHMHITPNKFNMAISHVFAWSNETAQNNEYVNNVHILQLYLYVKIIMILKQTTDTNLLACIICEKEYCNSPKRQQQQKNAEKERERGR